MPVHGLEGRAQLEPPFTVEAADRAAQPVGGFGQLRHFGSVVLARGLELGQFSFGNEIDRTDALALERQAFERAGFGCSVTDGHRAKPSSFGKDRRRAFEAFAGNTAHFDPALVLIFGAGGGSGAGLAGGGQALRRRVSASASRSRSTASASVRSDSSAVSARAFASSTRGRRRGERREHAASGASSSAITLGVERGRAAGHVLDALSMPCRCAVSSFRPRRWRQPAGHGRRRVPRRALPDATGRQRRYREPCALRHRARKCRALIICGQRCATRFRALAIGAGRGHIEFTAAIRSASWRMCCLHPVDRPQPHRRRAAPCATRYRQPPCLAGIGQFARRGVDGRARGVDGCACRFGWGTRIGQGSLDLGQAVAANEALGFGGTGTFTRRNRPSGAAHLARDKALPDREHRTIVLVD